MATDLWITGDADTDTLLAEDPFALLVGMLLDQRRPEPWTGVRTPQ